MARLTTRPALKIAAPLLGWATAVFLHFLHNLTVTFENGLCVLALVFDWGGVLLTAGIVVWALVQERRWIKAYLAEEVSLGTLSAAQYERSCSRRQMSRDRLQQWRASGWRSYRRSGEFYRRCSELAYKKHHYALFGDAESAALIEQLRGEVSSLSATIG